MNQLDFDVDVDVGAGIGAGVRCLVNRIYEKEGFNIQKDLNVNAIVNVIKKGIKIWKI